MINKLPTGTNAIVRSTVGSKKNGNDRSDASEGSYASVVAAQAKSKAPASADAIKQQKLNDQENAALASAGSGLRCALTSTSDIFKNQVLEALTGSSTDDVALTQITAQVVAGGGSEAQANALYKVMDVNSDGRVSAQEFKDSLTDPFSDAAYEQQFAAATLKGNSAALHLFQQHSEMPDLSQLLANMAKG